MSAGATARRASVGPLRSGSSSVTTTGTSRWVASATSQAAGRALGAPARGRPPGGRRGGSRAARRSRSRRSRHGRSAAWEDDEMPVDETVDTVDLDLHPNEASDLAVVPGWHRALRPDLRDRARRGRDRGVDRGPRASRRRRDARLGRGPAVVLAPTTRGAPRTPRRATSGASTCTCSARTSAPRTGRWRPSGRGSRGCARRTWRPRSTVPSRRSRSPATASACTGRSTTACASRAWRCAELGPRARERLVLRTIERGQEGQDLGGAGARRRPAAQHRGLLLPGRRDAAARAALPGDRRRRSAARRAAQHRGVLRRPRSPPELGAVWTLTHAGTRDDPVGIRALHRTADGHCPRDRRFARRARQGLGARLRPRVGGARRTASTGSSRCPITAAAASSRRQRHASRRAQRRRAGEDAVRPVRLRGRPRPQRPPALSHGRGVLRPMSAKGPAPTAAASSSRSNAAACTSTRAATAVASGSTAASSTRSSSASGAGRRVIRRRRGVLP